MEVAVQEAARVRVRGRRQDRVEVRAHRRTRRGQKARREPVRARVEHLRDRDAEPPRPRERARLA
jgi:hypothetical protein